MIRIITNDVGTDETFIGWLTGWNVGIYRTHPGALEPELLVEGRLVGTRSDPDDPHGFLCYEIAPVIGDDWDRFDNESTQLHRVDEVVLEVF